MKNAKMIPDSKPVMVGETGIQAAIRVKKTKDMMEEMAEAMMEARVMRGRRG
jgi:hypothetical protein